MHFFSRLRITELKLRRYNLFSGVAFCINPFVSLMFSAYYYFKGRDTSFFFALSLALIFVYFPIMYDTSSNFFAQYYVKENDVSNLYVVLPRVLRESYSINYYSVVYLYTAIIFYCWLKTLYYNFSQSESSRRLLYLIFIAIFSLNYRDVMDLNRNCLAIALTFYCILYLNVKYRKLKLLNSIVFLALSSSLHITALMVWGAYLVVTMMKLSRRKYIVILISCSIVGFILPTVLQAFSGVISSLDGPLGGRLSFYLFNSKFGVQVFTVSTALKKFLNYIILIGIAYLGVKYKKKNNSDKTVNVLLLLCSLAFLFSAYVTFFERLVLCITFFYTYLFFKDNDYKSAKKILLMLVVIRTLALDVTVYGPIFFGDYSDVLPDYDSKVDLELKPFYYPTPLLLDVDNGYSDKYLLINDKWDY
ncbi:EpsG family protein [Rouxiella badensis]|jgi:hypothetical protein|uniref:EpsG family protein n=1 Tax=Rouxiella badensis TaxID=1646377 RepID=UPI0013EF4430|nr:EpsG family protein [Rouxiella badensis]MCC3733296.1 EpsG family protein [Rouxiella badensis]MCC3758053.1 EpsG family protein [Rouxiella badensis]QII36377.1 hypothetical protein G3M83_01045 [Rouxiella badensis]WAT08720.1 EpsG family protein [Rouxiella badensis]